MSFAVSATVAFLTLSGVTFHPPVTDNLTTGTVPVLHVSAAPKFDFLISSPKCRDIAPPPSELVTQSKYNGDDPTRSAADEIVIEERNTLLEPVRTSVRRLTEMAYANRENPELTALRAACVVSNLTSWAKAGSFTDMQTMDAVLNRDRLVAEIALAFQEARKIVEVGDEDLAVIAPWLSEIADSTVDFYNFHMDRKATINNHRYWAGLAVAAIGYTVRNPELVQWGKGSYEIGACQVDRNGFLPMELARGRKALEYHIYALRPLLAIEKLVAENRDEIHSKCKVRMQLLKSATMNAMSDPSEIERAAGYVQVLGNKERSFSRGLQLVSLGVNP